MTTMAVFTIGANQFQVSKMTEYARNSWSFTGTYSDTKRLMDDGRAGRFAYVLVFDHEALESAIQKQLAGCGIEVLSFKDQKALQKAMEKEQEKKQRAEKEMKVRLDFEKDLAIIRV